MKINLLQLLDEYNFSNYDPRMFGTATGGSNPHIGKTRGSEFPVYTALDELILDDEEDEDQVNEDEFNLGSMNIDSASPRSRVDIGSRRDVGNFVTNVGGLKESPHTNTVPQGIMTGLSYRTSSGKKNQGSSITGRSSSYPMFNPGNYKRTGTQYGTSRAPKPHKGEINDNPIYSLDDILEPMERSWRKQQYTIKNLLNEINIISGEDNTYFK